MQHIFMLQHIGSYLVHLIATPKVVSSLE